MLHQFATKNPIYYNSFELKVNGQIDCIVYEGDINKYWLNSIQHGSSNAPFSPTWIMSAYIGALMQKNLDILKLLILVQVMEELRFVQSLGMESYSIELDDMLVDLQKLLVVDT